MQHTGLIYTIARRYLPLCDRATDLDDLMQAGAIGVLRAEQAHEPDKCAFSTLATFYIKSEMQTALGLRGSRIRAHRGATSIDAPHGEEGGTLAETLLDPSADFEEQHDRAEVRAVVQERVEAMEDETQRDLIKQTYLADKSITQAAVTLGIPYKDAKREHGKACLVLRKDRALMDLAEAHGLDRRTNWHYHRGLTAWRSDWMSTTEKLAFWRMATKG